MKTTISTMFVSLFFTIGAFASDSTVLREDRNKMAEMHMKMADCLKSEKPVSECHNEMKQSCDMVGKDGCSMMGPMHGKMHDKKKTTKK